MKEPIERMAKALVDNPAVQVLVSELETGNTLVIEFNVAKEDVGKVIGKQARTARALRDILGATSGKTKKRATLEIIDQ